MARRKKKHPLDGYTEAIHHHSMGSNWQITITRHLHTKNKTYFVLWFKNPRNIDTRDKREPEVYKWHYRMDWKKDILQYHVSTNFNNVQYHIHSSGHWTIVTNTGFGFDWTRDSILEKLNSIMMEYELGLHT